MELPETLASPLVEHSFARKERVFDTRNIVSAYAERFNIDVSSYFRNIPQIATYACEATHFKFFYPGGLAGEPSFYEALEKRIPDYYDEAKWEHELVAGWVNPGDLVLDIGCGRGGFLAKARQNGGIVTGLESNKAASGEAVTRGIEIVDELIEDHAENRPGHYDIVTAFQVLEHIPDPKPFLNACKAALKKGGLLVIAVPNDDGFIGMDGEAILNGPPHHLSLWNRDSLTALAPLLECRLERIDVEPLNHVAWCQAVIETRYVPKGWRRALWHRLGGSQILRRFLDENAKGISGHTIVAAYRKN